MFRNSRFQRTTSAFVLVAFTSLTLSPLARADNLALAAATRPTAADHDLSRVLSDLHADLKAAVPQHAHRRGVPHLRAAATPDTAGAARRIRLRHQEIKAFYDSVDSGFARTGEHLRSAGMPAVMAARHSEAVATFQSRRAQFEQLMENLNTAPDASAAQQAALASLGSFMAANPSGKSHQYTDPTRLPFGRSEAAVRAPLQSAEQFQARLFPPSYQPIMLAGAVPAGTEFTLATLAPTPAAADLAASDEVQITHAIRAQVQALGGQPLAIYHWVRNNITFVPSYGSIQGSAATFVSKRGNAFDTASLLIAMYRAAGIPARYVYGSIELPAAKVMNWVGGVTTPEAAQQLLGQGGIPNIGQAVGASVKAIRMEHVWVKAYVDASPGRGAVSRSANTWVPLDASFKQYAFTRGMNLQQNVPLDVAALATAAQQGASVNPGEGSVQNLQGAAITAQLDSYMTRASAYIESQKRNATVGDVYGSQTIIKENRAQFVGTLPYKTVAVGSTFPVMPERLKWQFKTNVYPSDGYSDSSAPIIEIKQSTASLAGKKIGLQFRPATQADADLIASYVPKAGAGGAMPQAGEFPTSLPAYLLRMKPVLTLDGVVVSESASAYTAGSELRQSNQYYNPSRGQWVGGDDNDITVGEINAIGLDLQGSGIGELSAVQARMGVIEAELKQLKLDPGNAALAAELQQADIMGELTHLGITAYFTNVDVNDSLRSLMLDTVTTYRMPSYGRFSTTIMPRYYFGIVRSIGFRGVGLDVDYLSSQAVAKDGNAATAARYMQQSGSAASLAESSVPEGMFANPALPGNDPSQPRGVSAIKALAIAGEQGQKIYTLGPDNASLHASIVSSLQIDADVKHEIGNALASGKVVTVHAKDISVGRWVGSGYLIADPGTGAGAFKIAGGSNGGTLDTVGNNSDALGFAFFVLGLIAATAGVGLVVGLLLLVVSIVIGAMAFGAAQLEAAENAQCAAQYECIKNIFLSLFLVNLALALIGLAVNPLVGLALGLNGLIFGDNLAKAASGACVLACRT